jgi:hypothetical protein
MFHDQFPVEKYIEMENEPYFLGRVTVNKYKETYHIELDIIHKETHKIYKHLGRHYGFHELNDALESGYQEMVKLIGRQP